MKDKDIYDLLNEIDINEEDLEVEEMETNDIEKMKVLNNLKGKIKSSNKNKKAKKGIAVASILGIVIISSAVIYNSDSILASDIPIIKNIFNLFGYKKDFEENANQLNLYKESPNANVTINEALFDGKNIFLTYTIKTKEPMDYNLYSNVDLKIVGNESMNLISTGGSTNEEKIDDYTIIGTIHRVINDRTDYSKISKLTNNISINILFDKVNYVNFDKQNYKEGDLDYNLANGEEKTINMKLDFDINLEALESDIYSVNKEIKDEKTNLNIFMDSIAISPIAVEIKYTWDTQNVFDNYKELKENPNILTIMLNLEDDLGNKYKSISLSGGLMSGNNYIQTYFDMFDKIDKDAKKLYIKPYYHISNGEYALDEDGTTEFIEFRINDEIQQLNKKEIGKVEINLKSLK